MVGYLGYYYSKEELPLHADTVLAGWQLVHLAANKTHGISQVDNKMGLVSDDRFASIIRKHAARHNTRLHLVYELLASQELSALIDGFPIS